MNTDTTNGDEPGLSTRLPADLVEKLAESGSSLRAPKGKTLFDIGDACEGFAILDEGSIRVVLPSLSGKEILLYRVRPGEGCILTLTCLVANARYQARGIADADLTGYVVPRSAFLRLLSENERFQLSVYRFLVDRLGTLVHLIEQLAFWKLPQRLAELLIDRGPEVRFTHMEIAEELGCSREIVSRHLEAFARDGLLVLGRQQIEIKDAGRLGEIATPV